MRKHVICALSVCVLGATAFAQSYAGEPPFKANVDIKPTGLAAKDFGSGITRVSQVHVVRPAIDAPKNTKYYLTATARRGSEDFPYTGTLEWDAQNGNWKVTENDDGKLMEKAGRGEFQATTSLYDSSLGAPKYLGFDSGSTTPPVWGEFDKTKGNGGQFVEKGPVTGVPSGYIDFQFVIFEGKLNAAWIDGAGNFSMGDFAAGKVTNVRTLANDQSQKTNGGIHSHTAVTDLKGDMHALIGSTRKNSSDAMYIAEGDPIFTAQGKTQEIHDLFNTAKGCQQCCDKCPGSWVNNPASIGGTALYASSSSGMGFYGTLWLAEFYGLSSESLKAPGTAKLHVFTPWRSGGAPVVATLFLGFKGSAGVSVPAPGFNGKVGLDLTQPLAIGPNAPVLPKDAVGTFNLAVPAGVKGDVEVQALVLDAANTQAFMTNNARVSID